MDGITAYAPGSASNLGPGLDCLGVAFTGKGDRVTARIQGPAGVRVRAVSDPRIPTDPSRNTAAIAAAAILRRAGSPAGLELEIEKGLPLAGGMGGSAASAVAGGVAADPLLRLRLGPDRVLPAAPATEAGGECGGGGGGGGGLGGGGRGVAGRGGGARVLALVLEEAAASVAWALEAAYRRLGIEAHAHPARVDHQGARVLS